MPLPVLPDNATARLWIDYTSLNIPHTMLIRLGAGATISDAATVAPLAANILKARMSTDDAFTAARFSLEDSDFSLPVTFTPVSGVINVVDPTTYWEEDPESAFIDFMGRGSSSSRRVRWEFFTIIRTPLWPTTNRYNPGASAPIDTLRINWTDFVNDGATTGQQVVTKGGDIPVVYGYVNIAKNSYWQRKQR